MSAISYKEAGVDIEAGNESLNRIKDTVSETFTPEVLTPLGQFAAMYDLKSILLNYDHPVLVQSIDGVGTKMMVAKMMQDYSTIGIDLVSATVNDIVVLGAKPLTLLDYVANDSLNPKIIEKIVNGIALACQELEIALVGGETAEMPGTYLPGEHDLVGIITGVVEKDKAILGKTIEVGDKVLGFTSSGLHTNGFSLARKILFAHHQLKSSSYSQDLQMTWGEALLAPHINYYPPIDYLLSENINIKGMAHITGGGLLENIPRILPTGCAVNIDLSLIPKLPIFELLCQLGQLEQKEAYRTFNMGIGMVLIVNERDAEEIKAKMQYTQYPLYQIGEVIAGDKKVRLI